MDYYFSVGDEKRGPFKLDELVNQGLQPDSLVWHQGLSSWIRFVEAPEIRDYLASGRVPMPTTLMEAIKAEEIRSASALNGAVARQEGESTKNSTSADSKPSFRQVLDLNPSVLFGNILAAITIGLVVVAVAFFGNVADDMGIVALGLFGLFGYGIIGWLLVSRVKRLHSIGVMTRATSVKWDISEPGFFALTQKMTVAYIQKGTEYITSLRVTDQAIIGRNVEIDLLVDPNAPTKCILARISVAKK